MTTKVCSKCKVEKALEEFPKDRNRKGGLRNHCKVCMKAYAAKWRADNLEKVKERSAKYRAGNQERIKAMHANWYPKWYTSNSEKVKAAMAKYRAENPEKVKAGKARYRAKNPDKIAAHNAMYRLNLSDTCVKHRLKVPNPPQELIELKRIQLRIHREIYKKG